MPIQIDISRLASVYIRQLGLQTVFYSKYNYYINKWRQSMNQSIKYYQFYIVNYSNE